MRALVRPRIRLGSLGLSQEQINLFRAARIRAQNGSAPAISTTPLTAPATVYTPIKQLTSPIADQALLRETSGPIQSDYSPDQIREMFARGTSETYERSGEDENGLPQASHLEQQARESDSMTQFAFDSGDETVPDTMPDKPDIVPLAVLAALAYFLLGA